MFADPQSITVNGVAHSLPRIAVGDLSASYEQNDGTFHLDISHQVTKQDRVRSLVRVSQKKVVTDPLNSVNDYDNLTLTFTLDRPSYGFSQTETEQLVAGLVAWLTTGNVDKLYGRES